MAIQTRSVPIVVSLTTLLRHVIRKMAIHRDSSSEMAPLQLLIVLLLNLMILNLSKIKDPVHSLRRNTDFSELFFNLTLQNLLQNLLLLLLLPVRLALLSEILHLKVFLSPLFMLLVILLSQIVMNGLLIPVLQITYVLQ